MPKKKSRRKEWSLVRAVPWAHLVEFKTARPHDKQESNIYLVYDNVV